MKNRMIMLGSIVPSIFLIISLVFVLIIFNLPNPDAQIPVFLRAPAIGWLILLLVSVIVIWGYIIGFTVHIIAYNKSLQFGGKVGWALAIWCLNFLFIPVYWYKYLRVINSNLS